MIENLNLITSDTANQLQALLSKGGGPTHGYSKGSNTQQVCFAKVSGSKVGNWYPCYASAYDSFYSSMQLYAASWIKDANDHDLKIGDHYLCISSAELADTVYYITSVATPFEDDSDSDSDSGQCFDVESIAGTGLVVEVVDGDCDKLAIDFTQVSGPYFDVITGLTANGCGVDYTRARHTIITNPDGIFIGLESHSITGGNVSFTDCPCNCDSAGSTSHGISSSSSTSGGATVSTSCGTVSETLQVDFSTGESFTITYSGGAWTGHTGAGFACDGTSGGCTLTCNSGMWTIGSYASFKSPDSQPVIPSSTSPFFLSVSATDSIICHSSFTVVISEV